uniref:C2H2-type domain-containing protein n=1 Tax=Trichobilharzia regenti TaxID=157069 RepID=A0AA85IVI1_TRIRE|nr:unnamed protein product [Trichobilharzia regenti]
MLYWSGLLLLHLNGHCSISQSRVARSVLHEVIFPLFDYTDVVIADQCPFNPKYDIYAVHEQMKNKISDYDWECQMCGKRFYTEKSFDSHIGNRHKINAYSQSRTICLASYCPLLRCSVLKPDFAYGNQMFWDEALCETGSFSDISKQCEDILNKCAPGNDSSHIQLHRENVYIAKVSDCVYPNSWSIHLLLCNIYAIELVILSPTCFQSIYSSSKKNNSKK